MKPFIAFALLVLVPACSGAPVTSSSGDFPAEILISLASTSGALEIAVRTSPQPPVRGGGSAQLTITDKQGVPASGLSLNVLPWMPVMGHGTSVTPSAVESSPGVYTVDDIYLPMPGLWALRTTISPSTSPPGGAGVSTDYVEPRFDIP